MATLGALWSRRDLILQLAARQVRRRYRGHLLGPAWPFLNPLAMLAVYTVIFSIFLKADYSSANPDWSTSTGARGHLEFALIVFAGMVAYNFFSDVAGQAPGLIRGEASYVKRTVFPLEILGPVNLLAQSVEAGIGLGIIILAQPALGHPWTGHMLLLPLALLPLVLLALASSWALSALGTYIPDIAEIVQIILRILFFLTPVLYPLEVAPSGVVGAMALNPLASILHGIRNVLLFGKDLVWPSWFLATAVTGAMAWLAHRLFSRLRPGFADVV